MQIVIDIPESIYDTIQSDEMISREQLAILQMHIMNGTLLPKGHGRLIDADTLEECKEVMNTIMNECEYAVRMDEVRNVPTIIEADKAEGRDKE